MQWTDEGIVLGIRRHGEANAILELMTREHGRHLGLVRGGAGSRLRPVLQPGNRDQRHWRARLDEHLGHLSGRGASTRAPPRSWQAPHAVYGVTHLAALCRLLPERDPHPQIHAALDECWIDCLIGTGPGRMSCASSCGCSPSSASASICRVLRGDAARGTT